MMNRENTMLTLMDISSDYNIDLIIADRDTSSSKTYRKSEPGIYSVNLKLLESRLKDKNIQDSSVFIYLPITDRDNKMTEIFVNLSSYDYEYIRRVPYIITELVTTVSHGFLKHSAPIGFLSMSRFFGLNEVDKDRLSTIPMQVSDSYKSEEVESIKGYYRVRLSNSMASDRTIVKTDDAFALEQLSDVLYEYDSNETKLQEFLDSIKVYDNAEIATPVERVVDSVNISKKDRDPIANLKKVRAGIIKDGELKDIKRTSFILCKNKNIMFGRNADEVRRMSYERIKEELKDVDADSIRLLECFRVNTIIGNPTLELDDVIHNMAYKFIDETSHRVIDENEYILKDCSIHKVKGEKDDFER